MSEQVYFLLIDDQQAGPYTLMQVQALSESGIVNADTAFWTEGREDWGNLSEISSLLEGPEDSFPSDEPESDNHRFVKKPWGGKQLPIILTFFGGSMVCVGLVVGFHHKQAIVAPSPAWTIVEPTRTPLLQIAKVNASPNSHEKSATEVLQVTSATYGAESLEVDVTEKVQAILQGGKTEIRAETGTLSGTDPAPGKVKTLLVSYSQGGKEFEASVREGQTLSLSALESADVRQSQAVNISDYETPTPRLAPKGIFFLLQHASVTTKDGIAGINPGTVVRIIADRGFTLHVTDGTHDFDIARNLVTNEIAMATQAAENDRNAQLSFQHFGSDFRAYVKEQKESEARDLAQAKPPINTSPFQPGRTVMTTNTFAASASSILSHNLVNPDNNKWNPLDRGAFNSDLKARSVGQDIQHRLNDIEPAFQAAASEIDSLLKAGQNPSAELSRRYNDLYQERESLIQVGGEAYKQSHYNFPQ